MSELPDFKKISFSEMPAIPLQEVVTDASPEVSHLNEAKNTITVADSAGNRFAKEVSGLRLMQEDKCKRGELLWACFTSMRSSVGPQTVCSLPGIVC